MYEISHFFSRFLYGFSQFGAVSTLFRPRRSYRFKGEEVFHFGRKVTFFSPIVQEKEFAFCLPGVHRLRQWSALTLPTLPLFLPDVQFAHPLRRDVPPQETHHGFHLGLLQEGVAQAEVRRRAMRAVGTAARSILAAPLLDDPHPFGEVVAHLLLLAGRRARLTARPRHGIDGARSVIGAIDEVAPSVGASRQLHKGLDRYDFCHSCKCY